MNIKIIKLNMSNKLIILLFICFNSFSLQSLASSTLSDFDQNNLYLLQGSKKLECAIGEGVANRIEFGLLGFREVIGDSSKYTFITDQKHKNIYLTPKIAAGNEIDLSLINMAGEIVDLRLNVEKVEGQIIKIMKKDFRPSSGEMQNHNEIVSIINAMQKDLNLKEKYYVTSIPRKITAKDDKLVLVQDRTFKYKNLFGARIIARNLSDNLKQLDKSDFIELFESPVALSFQKKVLRSGEKGFVYLISMEDTHD